MEDVNNSVHHTPTTDHLQLTRSAMNLHSISTDFSFKTLFCECATVGNQLYKSPTVIIVKHTVRQAHETHYAINNGEKLLTCSNVTNVFLKIGSSITYRFKGLFRIYNSSLSFITEQSETADSDPWHRRMMPVTHKSPESINKNRVANESWNQLVFLAKSIETKSTGNCGNDLSDNWLVLMVKQNWRRQVLQTGFTNFRTRLSWSSV